MKEFSYVLFLLVYSSMHISEALVVGLDIYTKKITIASILPLIREELLLFLRDPQNVV